MRSIVPAAIASSLLLSGCATGPEGVPKNLRPDARIRLKECNAWSDSIAPSRDNSGNISIAGTGLGLRSAVYRNTGAQNEYLIGIRLFIEECERWAKFKINDQEYRAAKLNLSALAERTLTPASFNAALDELSDQLRQANSQREAAIDDLRSDEGLDQARETPEDKLTLIENRLIEIEQLLRTSVGATEPEGADTAIVDGTASDGVTRFRHSVFFEVNSSPPQPSEVGMAKQKLQIALAFCEKRHWLFSGYSDQSGGRGANLELSFARAQAMSQAFAEEIGADDATVLAGGMTGRFGSNLATNRTVQIEVSCAEPDGSVRMSTDF